MATPTWRRRAGSTLSPLPTAKSSSVLAATAPATGPENWRVVRSRSRALSASASAHPLESRGPAVPPSNCGRPNERHPWPQSRASMRTQGPASVTTTDGSGDAATIRRQIAHRGRPCVHWTGGLCPGARSRMQRLPARPGAPNLYMVSVVILSPSAEVVAEVDHVGLLDATGSRVRLFVPTSISPRYVPCRWAVRRAAAPRRRGGQPAVRTAGALRAAAGVDHPRLRSDASRW
jgi:hypothetical protein